MSEAPALILYDVWEALEAIGQDMFNAVRNIDYCDTLSNLVDSCHRDLVETSTEIREKIQLAQILAVELKEETGSYVDVVKRKAAEERKVTEGKPIESAKIQLKELREARAARAIETSTARRMAELKDEIRDTANKRFDMYDELEEAQSATRKAAEDSKVAQQEKDAALLLSQKAAADLKVAQQEKEAALLLSQKAAADLKVAQQEKESALLLSQKAAADLKAAKEDREAAVLATRKAAEIHKAYEAPKESVPKRKAEVQNEAQLLAKKPKLEEQKAHPLKDAPIFILKNEDDDSNMIIAPAEAQLLSVSNLLKRMFQNPDDISVYDPTNTRNPKNDFTDGQRYVFFEKLIARENKTVGGDHILKDPVKERNKYGKKEMFATMEIFIYWLTNDEIIRIDTRHQRTRALKLAEFLEVSPRCGFQAALESLKL